MALLAGKPVLQHVIERCKDIKISLKFNKLIIVVAPDTNESEPLINLATKLGVENFCGSEDNVLERYYHAAQFFKLNHIMRITADCPLINPVICTEVLDLHIWRKCDYTSNIHPKRTFPRGLDCECFTFDCLQAAYVKVMEEANKFSIEQRDKNKGEILGAHMFRDKAKYDQEKAKYDQEHVTSWMQNEPEIKKALVRQKRDKSSQNLCVDYPEDIERLEKIINKKKPKLVISK